MKRTKVEQLYPVMNHVIRFMKWHWIYSTAAGLVLFACAEKETRFTLLDASRTNVSFRNTIVESDSINMLEFSNIYNGSGVGIGDFNNDGKPDLYFSGNMVSGALYLNTSEHGKIIFEDVTEISRVSTSRWATGVSVADVNQDGLVDIYVCVSGAKQPEVRKNYFFINRGINEQGVPIFDEVAENCGIADETYSTQAAFFDYDKDGDLDLFIAVNYPENFYGSSMNKMEPVKETYSERTGRLYRNMGIGTDGLPHFEDVSAAAGICHEGYSLGLAIQDTNDDGWPDIYLSNDFLSNDKLNINNGNGTFSNKLGVSFKHTTFAGMGCDIADFNNDTRPDMAVLDMMPDDNVRQKQMLKSISPELFKNRARLGYFNQFNRNTLQLNNGITPEGNLSFSEISQLAGIHYTDWSWSVLFADFTNSGWKDVHITNGFRRDMQNLDVIGDMFKDFDPGDPAALNELLIKVDAAPEVFIENRFYENNEDLTFTNQTNSWGITRPTFSSGAAFADLDSDGDLDLVVCNLNDTPHIYRNNTISGDNGPQKSNYLRIDFSRAGPGRSYLGTKVYLTSGNQTQYSQYYPVRGYLSSVESSLHFGMGNDTTISKIMIVLPDDTRIELSDVAANRTVKIGGLIAQGHVASDEQKAAKSPWFSRLDSTLSPDYKHAETEYEDSSIQPLILRKYSQMGPALAAADINSDGLDDFFVGGAVGQNGQIFIQSKDGEFSLHQKVITNECEDMGAVFFDADGDGDNDLYVAAGGVEFNNIKYRFRDKLFLNDGLGHFVWDSLALPLMSAGKLTVNVADFDGDGDLDLFVGGGVDLPHYPKATRSYLLRNQSRDGRVVFEDVTADLAPELEYVGMVTSSLWTDFNSDGQVDLILVGEWMPVTFFMNTGNGFRNITSDMEDLHLNGWWSSIAGGDFDKDGDIDYVLGNYGLNSRYRASADEPILMFASDFNNDGRVDPLMFQFINGVSVPIPTRDLILAQISSWASAFPSHEHYARFSYDDFKFESYTSSIERYYVDELRTVFLRNEGNGTFTKHFFNNIVQMSNVAGIAIDDYNADGNLDMLLSGNYYATEYTNGPLDASTGFVLSGNGDGTFHAATGIESGLLIDTDSRAMVALSGNDGRHIVLSSTNNGKVSAFNLKNAQHKRVQIEPGEILAIIHYDNGSIEKREFYYSAGYLSAPSRFILANATMTSIDFFMTGGQKSRSIDLAPDMFF